MELKQGDYQVEKLILNALAAMDPNDDSQWTAEGLPVLAKVVELAGSAEIARKDLDAASNGFNRDVARDALKAKQEDQADPLGEDAPKQPEAAAAPDAPAAQPEQSTAAPVNRRRLLQDDVEAAKQRLDDHDSALSGWKRHRESLEKSLTLAVKRQHAEFPPQRPADATRHYLNSQRDARVKRAGLVTQSRQTAPIDQVFRRKTGYGHGRPTPHLMVGAQAMPGTK